MSRIHGHGLIVVAGLLIAIAAFPASAQVKPASGVSPTSLSRRATQSNLYTTFSFWTGYTSVGMVVCGSTAGSSGCYGSAQLGPFGHAGALLAGKELTPRRGTTIRDLYVVDDAAGDGTGVTLNIYQETITVASPNVTISVTPASTITLPLKGGTGAKTYMAGNDGYLYIGTDQSPFAVQVDKSTLAFGQIGGFSPPANVSLITTNDKGYVTVGFGTGGVSTGFYTYAPNGYLVEDGGGADFMLNSSSGISTGNVSTTTGVSSGSRLKVRYKRALPRAASGN